MTWATMRRSISRNCSADKESMASQNRRWSRADVGTFTQRSPAVVCHHSANARFERGSATRLATANAM